MADRVRDMAKRSGSKLHISKGSVSHIGATPYRFRLDIFVSYVDNVKNATEVCVSWERRGKAEVTNVAKVKDKKAVFRQSLSMESTLFRRAGHTPKASSADPEELKFDEKRAKFILRKGGPDGKAIGKIALNLADYVRGTNSTVFADMKLSNGSVIVTKIQATMLHTGKKKKGTGSKAGSEACSEMTDINSAENDSIFGDDDRDLGDIEIETTPAPDDDMPLAPARETARETKRSDVPSMSPISSAASSSTQSLARRFESKEERESERNDAHRQSFSSSKLSLASKTGTPKSAVAALKNKDSELQESPSLRDRLKNKVKGKKEKDKNKDKDSEEAESGRGGNLASNRRASKNGASREQAAEIAELKACVESMKKENAKLKKSKQAAMEEIDALRADLEACEAALEEATDADGTSSSQPTWDMTKSLKEKDKKISELQAQNESLLEELEDLHEGAVDSAVGVASGQMAALKKKIEDLEIALRREPHYMDVVNELKVTKVSLALANMEKEQALFALQNARAMRCSSESE